MTVTDKKTEYKAVAVRRVHCHSNRLSIKIQTHIVYAMQKIT